MYPLDSIFSLTNPWNFYGALHWSLFKIKVLFLVYLTLYRMGGGARRLPYQFFPVTSTNVKTSPQNFLTFSFNPFGTLMQNFKFVFSVSHKLVNLNQSHPSKKRLFLSNPYKLEVMIDSLIEMLELPKFAHMTTFTI